MVQVHVAVCLGNTFDSTLDSVDYLDGMPLDLLGITWQFNLKGYYYV